MAPWLTATCAPPRCPHGHLPYLLPLLLISCARTLASLPLLSSPPPPPLGPSSLFFFSQNPPREPRRPLALAPTRARRGTSDQRRFVVTLLPESFVRRAAAFIHLFPRRPHHREASAAQFFRNHGLPEHEPLL